MAENAAGVLATANNLLYETNKYYILSNQWIPLYEKCSIQEKCKLGSLLDKKCGGGQISHINIEGRFPNTDVAWDMLKYLAEQGVIYSAFNPKIGTCDNEHASIGCSECPECGEPIVETWSRVVGFFRPTSSFQNIRKREFDQRKWYDTLLKPEM